MEVKTEVTIKLDYDDVIILKKLIGAIPPIVAKDTYGISLEDFNRLSGIYHLIPFGESK